MGVFRHRANRERASLVAAALVGLSIGCASPSPFVCGDDSECIRDGTPGTCEDNHYCSFPDPECPDGNRWGEHAPNGIAGHCVPADGVADGSTGGATLGESTGGVDPSTTGGLTQADDSLTDSAPPSESEAGSDGGGSTGAAEESTSMPVAEESTGEPPAESSTGGQPAFECAQADLGNDLGDALASDSTDNGSDVVGPSCAGVDSLDMSYLWTAPWDGRFAFSILDADYDSVLLVSDAECDGGELRCNDDLFGLGSGMTLDLVADQPVRITVDAADGSSGWFDLGIYDASDLDCAAEGDLGGATGMVASGSNAGLDSTFDSACSGVEGSSDMVWRWTAPVSAWYTFSTVGSTYDTTLGLIWPSCGAAEVVCSDDAVDVASEFNTAVAEGETVLILLDAYEPQEGDFVLTITQN